MKDRIIKLMEKEGLTPGRFAEEVGIQRSAVSHIVTGRNRPSLEVAQKILNTFRTINSDWLILGVGPMYRGEKQPPPSSLFDFSEENTEKQDDTKEMEVLKKQPDNTPEKNNDAIITQQSIPVVKSVKKIIVFYSDSTFEEFNK